MSDENAEDDVSQSLRDAVPDHPKAEASVLAHGEEQRITLTKALAMMPKEMRIIVEQTAITVTFILADILVVWLVGLAFADVIKAIPFVSYFYDFVKVASVFVITVRYVLNCIIELNKSGKKLISDLRLAEPGEDR